MATPPFARPLEVAGWAGRTVFQPVIDLSAWSVIGFEALARFDDGSQPPVRLAGAEAEGRREDLELELIRRAVAASNQLPVGMFVTINASGTTILRPELTELLPSASRSWGIELYEGETPADLASIRERVTSMGGELLVDDAGTAHADENRIRVLRPDVVKLDRALFWAAAADPMARARVVTIVDAARDAGARMLVEGIAEPGHVDLARSLGADLAQGFHLGMPTPADQMLGALRELHRSIGVDAPGL